MTETNGLYPEKMYTGCEINFEESRVEKKRKSGVEPKIDLKRTHRFAQRKTKQYDGSIQVNAYATSI